LSAPLALTIACNVAMAAEDCPNFSAPFSVVATGGIPVDILGTDLDGDGRDDFVLANYYTQSITVLSADLARHQELGVRLGPRALAAADIDGDSRQDIAVACLGRVSLLRGQTDGTYTDWPVLWTEPTVVQITAGDFDADGITDLVTLRVLGTGPNRVELWRGAGNGTFAPGVTLVLPAEPEVIAGAQLDAGPTFDLAIGTAAGLILWYGGETAPEPTLPLPGIATMIAARAQAGLAVAYQANIYGSPVQHVVWVRIDAGGNATFESDAVVPEYAFDLAIADIDADDVQDVLVLGARLQPLRRAGATFQYGRPADAGALASAIAMSDVDSDGHIDAVIADASNTGVLVASGHGDDWFGNSPLFTASLPQAVVLGDVNGDGRLDAVFVGALFGHLAVHAGVGNGTFGVRTDVTTVPWAAAAALGDLDGDGALDIAVASYEDFRNPLRGRLAVHRGDGRGGFGPPQVTDLAGPATGLCIADWDADGRLDVAVSVWDHRFPADGGVQVFRGHGDLTFAAPLTLAVGPLPMGVAAGDLDADGWVDLVVTFRQFVNERRGGVTWWRGAPGFTFTGRADVPTGVDPRRVVIARVDSDAIPDVVVANSHFSLPEPGQLVVLRATGNALIKTADVRCAGETFAPVVADFDGDGAADIAVTNSATHTIHLWRGDGTGALDGGCEIGTGPRPISLAVGDLNGDMRPDLVTADAGGASATVILRVGGPTPVTLAAFTARRSATGVELEWTLAAPQTAAWVQVERASGLETVFEPLAGRLVPAPTMQFTDTAAPLAAAYRLRIASHTGAEWTSAAIAADAAPALDFAAPILAADGVRFHWSLPHAMTRAHLQIVDARGRRVRDLVDGTAIAGTHAAVWDRRDSGGRSVARGLYWATLVADGRRLSRRVLVTGR